MSRPEGLIEVPGFIGYWASEDGGIWSDKRGGQWINAKWSNGYVKVSLTFGDGSARSYGVHRVIASVFLGLDLNDMTREPDHINKVRNDNRVANLRVLTKSENMQARYGLLGADTETHKFCIKCGMLSLRAYFTKRAANSDGLNRTCRLCQETSRMNKRRVAAL